MVVDIIEERVECGFCIRIIAVKLRMEFLEARMDGVMHRSQIVVDLEMGRVIRKCIVER